MHKKCTKYSTLKTSFEHFGDQTIATVGQKVGVTLGLWGSH